MRSSAWTVRYASYAWSHSSLLIEFVWELLAVRNVRAHFIELVLAGVEELVVFDGFEKTSGS